MELCLMLAKHALSVPHLSGPLAPSGVWLPSYGGWHGRGGDQWHLGRRGLWDGMPKFPPPCQHPCGCFTVTTLSRTDPVEFSSALSLRKHWRAKVGGTGWRRRAGLEGSVLSGVS